MASYKKMLCVHGWLLCWLLWLYWICFTCIYPDSPIHGTLAIARRCCNPFFDAMHMKNMRALSTNKRTIVSRKLAIWTTSIIGNSANAAYFILVVFIARLISALNLPSPLSYCVIFLNYYAHMSGKVPL